MTPPTSASVINVPLKNIDNRRTSDLQRQILHHLETVQGPSGGYIGHLPRTGDLVDAVGRQRGKAGFASVSRALSRLCRDGLVERYVAEVCIRGRGYRYALAEGAFSSAEKAGGGPDLLPTGKKVNLRPDSPAR